MEIRQEIYTRLFGYRPTRGDATRVKILQAAIELMSQGGIEAVTFDGLGDKIGIGKANVRYHFNDKQDIFLAAAKLIVMHAQDLTVNLVRKAKTPDDQLKAVVKGACDWAMRFPLHAKVWLQFLSFCTHDEKYSVLHNEVKETGKHRLAAILKSLGPKHLTDEMALEKARNYQNLMTAELIDHLTCKFSVTLAHRQKNILARIAEDLKNQGIKWKV